ncbi:YciI family protein, partial [Stenotrophomonas maltophilia]|uniref:YciI family protein n=2 Tax=Pseudomonadota TaxID=1224 RepID=UPI001953E32D
NDMTEAPTPAMWQRYFERLNASGRFDGGSEIGAGACFRQAGEPAPLSERLGGYIRVRAEDIEDARTFLIGNPVHACGGTVEIRELPRA